MEGSLPILRPNHDHETIPNPNPEIPLEQSRKVLFPMICD